MSSDICPDLVSKFSIDSMRLSLYPNLAIAPAEHRLGPCLGDDLSCCGERRSGRETPLWVLPSKKMLIRKESVCRSASLIFRGASLLEVARWVVEARNPGDLVVLIEWMRMAECSPWCCRGRRYLLVGTRGPPKPHPWSWPQLSSASLSKTWP